MLSFIINFVCWLLLSVLYNYKNDLGQILATSACVTVYTSTIYYVYTEHIHASHLVGMKRYFTDIVFFGESTVTTHTLTLFNENTAGYKQ